MSDGANADTRDEVWALEVSVEEILALVAECDRLAGEAQRWRDAVTESRDERDRLAEQVRISYPATPVDCMLSDLAGEFELGGLEVGRFTEIISEFRAVLSDSEEGGRR